MRLPAGIVAALLALVLPACTGEYPQSTLHPTADFGYEIDALYQTIFWWAVGVFIVVEAALIFTVIKFRDRPDADDPKPVHGNTVLEMAWTLAPAIVLIFIAIPTIQTIMRSTGEMDEGSLEVEVIGHQWWWEYRYPSLGVVTANEMHVPQGRRVSLRMSSADVIHSFWAPKLGGKRDVMPGRTTRIAFTPDSVGTFMGQCAEFCGESHANMRLRVVVDGPADFDAWVTRQSQAAAPADSLTDLERAGLEAFLQVRQPANHSCIACHAVEGVAAGVLGPNLTHVASRQTIAAGILPMDVDGLTRWLRDPIAEKPGSLMPDIDLSDDEISALVAYLMSLR
jgi:cytochrome c oxidase subunit 2